jgi:hypothetical protein
MKASPPNVTFRRDLSSRRLVSWIALIMKTDLGRPWQGLPRWKDELATKTFDSLVEIKVGRGGRVLFWTDCWLDGNCVQDVVPTVLSAVNPRMRSKRTMQEALQNDRWTTKIISELPPEGFQQYVQLCMLILTTNLSRNPEE